MDKRARFAGFLWRDFRIYLQKRESRLCHVIFLPLAIGNCYMTVTRYIIKVSLNFDKFPFLIFLISNVWSVKIWVC
jgi:hypothetical protein